MKFDVEGCECHCLKSAKTLFERHTVNYVFIETDRAASANCGCSPQFFVDFFQKAGELDIGVLRRGYLCRAARVARWSGLHRLEWQPRSNSC